MPENIARPAVDHLKEVAWGIFMIDLVLVLLALLFRRHLGSNLSFWLFGGLAASVTVVIGGIALLNVVVVLAYDRWKGRSGAHRRPPIPSFQEQARFGPERNQ